MSLTPIKAEQCARTHMCLCVNAKVLGFWAWNYMEQKTYEKHEELMHLT